MKRLLFFFMMTIFISCGSGGGSPEEEESNKPAFPVASERYDIGTVSSEEAYALELINRARSNPQKEAQFLVNSGDSDIQAGISYFKVDTNKVISDFNSYEKRMPLAFNKKLMQVALATAQMQIDYNAQGHTLDGRAFGARFDDADYKYYTIGEDVYAYSRSVLHSHGAFNIDWGPGTGGVQNPPGHRHTIMGIGNASAFKEIGIKVENTIPSGKSVGPQIVTHDVGAQRSNNNNYITGVIYDDKNNNNFYDIGEGIPNVTISPDKGKYYAITDESGAYTIPFKSSDGITKVEAFGDNFNIQVASVSLKNENYKLDFNIQKTGANGSAETGFNKLNLKKKSIKIIKTQKEYAPVHIINNKKIDFLTY